MPIKFAITPEDMKRSQVVEEPGWYPVKVVEVKEGQSDDGSQTIEVHLQVVGGKYDGCTARKWFSEKAASFAKNFLTSCGQKVDAVKGGVFDFEACRGKTIEAFLKSEKWKGVDRTIPEDYRPARVSAGPAQTP